jgi:hypothetical protein
VKFENWRRRWWWYLISQIQNIIFVVTEITSVYTNIIEFSNIKLNNSNNNNLRLIIIILGRCVLPVPCWAPLKPDPLSEAQRERERERESSLRFTSALHLPMEAQSGVQRSPNPSHVIPLPLYFIFSIVYLDCFYIWFIVWAIISRNVKRGSGKWFLLQFSNGC